MFTIEHEFDATVITLIDEGPPPLAEDIVIRVDEQGARVEQVADDPGEGAQHVVLSTRQLRELGRALNLPEGVYRLTRKR